VGAWLGAVLLLAAIVNRYTSADAEIMRKVVHIGNVIFVPGLLHTRLGRHYYFNFRVQSLCCLINSLFCPVSIVLGAKAWGHFFYAVSIGLLIAWFGLATTIVVLGVLVMTWGDGLAALIGQRLANIHKIWGMKSWEGSLTMALVSYIVSSLIFLGLHGNVWQCLDSTGSSCLSRYQQKHSPNLALTIDCSPR